MTTSPPLRTLVIGGSGFIGQALVNALVATAGRDIQVVGRSPWPRHRLPSGVRYQQGDVGNHTLMEELMQQADEIVDLAFATVPQTSFLDPWFDVVANLPHTVRRLQLASQSGIRRYLLVSSGGAVYGDSAGAPIAEDDATNPISPYGISKLMSEKYALFFQQTAGLPVLLARPGNPYGVLQVGQTVQGFVGASVAAIRAGREVRVFGARGTVRDYLLVDDLARGLLAVLERGQIGRAYNLGSGTGHDNLDILNHLRPLAEAEGLSLRITHLEDRPFDVRRNVLDCRRALADCGWRAQTPLAEGLSLVWQQSRAMASHLQEPFP